jgi:hypothetical protein
MCGGESLGDDLDHIIVIIEVLPHAIRTKGAQNYMVHIFDCAVSI